jgi:putative copper resistance protein D
MGDWLLIGIRFALYLTLTVLFGLSTFGFYGLRGDGHGNAIALRPWLVASAVLSLLLSVGWVVLLASSLAGTPAWPIDHEAIGALLTGSAIGAAWQVRMVMLVLATIAAMFASGRGVWLGVVALSSTFALAALAWTGHGAVDEAAAGWLHLAADILHLIASGMWVGALLGLLLLVSRPLARVDSAHLGLAHRALHGFGMIGTVVVATIVVTGLVNALMLVGIGNVVVLPTTLYGQLLLAKLALVAAMLGLASLNRFRLTPTFKRSIAANDFGSALGALRASLAVETACAVAVLGLVAWLGTLAPPASSGM